MNIRSIYIKDVLYMYFYQISYSMNMVVYLNMDTLLVICKLKTVDMNDSIL